MLSWIDAQMSGKRSFFDPNGPHRREKITGQKTKWKMIERKVKKMMIHFSTLFVHFQFCGFFRLVHHQKVAFFLQLKRKTKVFLELEKIECIDELIR